MATIEKQKKKYGSISYRVRIQKKGFLEISKNFNNEEDAKLFAAWKEDIMDQIESFNPDMKELMTLGAAIDLKEIQLREKGANIKDGIADIQRLKKQFEKFLDISLCNITYENYITHANLIIKTPVKHGGDPKNINTGVLRLPAKKTILSRFNVLQSVYSYMNELGINIENHPNKIIKYLKTL